MSAGKLMRKAYKKAPTPSLTSGLVTPTMLSWNQFSAFIEEWDDKRLRIDLSGSRMMHCPRPGGSRPTRSQRPDHVKTGLRTELLPGANEEKTSEARLGRAEVSVEETLQQNTYCRRLKSRFRRLTDMALSCRARRPRPLEAPKVRCQTLPKLDWSALWAVSCSALLGSGLRRSGCF